MSGKWGIALIAFLLGVFVANRVGFLQPIAGSKS
jgi:hypothetical protein